MALNDVASRLGELWRFATAEQKKPFQVSRDGHAVFPAQAMLCSLHKYRSLFPGTAMLQNEGLMIIITMRKVFKVHTFFSSSFFSLRTHEVGLSENSKFPWLCLPQDAHLADLTTCSRHQSSRPIFPMLGRVDCRQLLPTSLIWSLCMRTATQRLTATCATLQIHAPGSCSLARHRQTP